MTVVRKKSRSSSSEDLKAAMIRLTELLDGQKEQEAADDLRTFLRVLEENQPQSAEFQGALAKVVDAFEGDHELNAYTYKREKKDDSWSAADDLFLASTSVITLVRRLLRK